MTTWPADTAASPAPEQPAQTMGRAPHLPPVLATPSGPSPAQAGTPSAADPSAARVLAAVTAQHRSATELHLAFLRQQAVLYGQLAALRPQPEQSVAAVEETVLDPAAAPWLLDHRPTWTVPAMPMMSIADHLATTAARHSGRPVRAVRDLRMRRWLPVPGPVRLRTTVTGPADRPTATLALWWEANDPTLSRYADVTTAQIETGTWDTRRPERFAPLTDPRTAPDPYESGELFHGPGFQYLVALRTGAEGASGLLDADHGGIPHGLLKPGLLDAATHVINQAGQGTSDTGRPTGLLGFPHRLARLRVFDPLPKSGRIEVEARFSGFEDGQPTTPVYDLQLCDHGRVLVDFRLVLMLLPAGAMTRTAPGLRRAYLRDRQYVPELLLSTTAGGTTTLRRTDVEALDTPPGAVAVLYGLPPGPPGRDRLARIAAKEHVARRLAVHPGHVEVDNELRTARTPGDPAGAIPAGTIPLDVRWDRDTATVTDGPEEKRA
ncbi:polyketide synthase dehydratase domain-containing protein [Kitasatospora aureofaciens]|uniref:polyketide synthase dehydratase domain-containing protein n=1 Tax=Kitasatospora aureofaciens TaxID=1894 RepID=UPI001DF2ED48|nr:polyketide synthase dehydratase domain-containing protein [Kitasatospora aureofaciens]HJD83787.1 polyketide synthase dehydratase domain-containing protein [Kitasatospora aureofaciens]